MGEAIRITRTPSLANDEPILAEGAGGRVKDIVDRLRAGDSVSDVAGDFNIHTDSVRLLWGVAKALSFKPEPGNGLDGLQHPDCRACEERKRVSLGQIEEIRQLKHKLMDAGSLTAEKTEAAKKLWEAATEHWNKEDEETGELIPLERLLDQSSVSLPGMALRGKELYRIGVELGFIEEVEPE